MLLVLDRVDGWLQLRHQERLIGMLGAPAFSRRSFLGASLALGASLTGLPSRRARGQGNALRLVGAPFLTAMRAISPGLLGIQSADGPGPIVACAISDGLVSMGPNGEVVPDLALHWSPVSGPRVWDVVLRPGVSPTAIVSQVLALNSPGAPVSVTPLAFEHVGLVADCFVVGSSTVRFRLHYPEPDFPALLAGPSWRFPYRITGSSRRAPYEVAVANGLSDPAAAHLLLASPDAASSAPLLEFEFADGPSVRVERVVSREADIAFGVGGASPDLLEEAMGAGARLVRSACVSTPLLMVSDRSAYGSRRDLLLAVKGTFDRPALVESLYGGFARAGSHTLLDLPPGTSTDCVPEPAVASALLRGHRPLPESFRLVYSYADDAPFARGVAAHLSGVFNRPVSADLLSPENPGYAGAVFRVASFSQVLGPSALLRLYAAPDWPPSSWTPSRTYDLALARMLASPDPRERAYPWSLLAHLVVCSSDLVIPVLPDRLDLVSGAVSLDLGSTSPDRVLPPQMWVSALSGARRLG